MGWTQPMATLDPNESTERFGTMVVVVSDHPFTGNSHTDLQWVHMDERGCRLWGGYS